MFQNSEISFSEKNFFRLLRHCHESESRYCNEIPKAETPLCMHNQRRGLSLFGSHGKGLKAGCLIAIREYQSRSKIFRTTKNEIISIKFQNYIYKI